jgi:hypothetical protein
VATYAVWLVDKLYHRIDIPDAESAEEAVNLAYRTEELDQHKAVSHVREIIRVEAVQED